ncbi:MAG: PKD domain-containing protein, partial [Deltaproteobacteria bacterium]|nr:PKD domain-containing protein [Deltaproteobacteria bacterium]
MSKRTLVRLMAVASALVATSASSPALAHWCDCLWASGYNLVLRPAQDSVSVPASGNATLDVFIQNNMGYPLSNFVLYAKATGYTINVTGPSPKVLSYLMPGEKLRRTLTLSKSGGGSLTVEAIDFYVSFGNSGGGQSRKYGKYSSPHNAVAIKKADGSLAPAGFPAIGQPGSGDQGQHLCSAAVADFGTLDDGLDALMDEYCAGRGSWDSGGGSSLCEAGAPPASCPARLNDTGLTKAEAQHLWAAPALASRKSALGATRIATLRTRLQCGWNDEEPTARYMAAFALGYLGADPTARTFLLGIAGGSNANDALVAKAALYLMGEASYKAEVEAGANPAGDSNVASVCAGALGIVDDNDQAVTAVLLEKARWECPGSCDANDPADPKPFFAAHILSIVSWDRRGYATMAGDTGDPSYFGTGTVDTVAPKAPTQVTCTASPGGSLRVGWTAVTQGVDNNPESSVSYRVYSDNAAHLSCTRPGDAGCNYAHVDPASSIYRDYPDADGTRTYYFRVTAVDASTNESTFSTEVSCVPRYAPSAELSCTPASGDAPLDVTCSAAGSADQNGSADIASYSFQLDSNPPESGTSASKAYHFDVAGGHAVQLIVTDSTGLTDTAMASITVRVAGNNPPEAHATAEPTSGPAPLAVQFDSAGSSDLDGDALTYSWSFGDGSEPATAERPAHTYPNAGSYTATLTVTDDGDPPASSSAMVSIQVNGNRPPDLSSASANPLTGQPPLLVHFDATGVTDPEGDEVTVTWDFGDGSTISVARAVDHTYSQTGSYTAALRAQDDGLPAAGPSTTTFTIEVGAVNH